jgi:hypothetical protein
VLAWKVGNPSINVVDYNVCAAQVRIDGGIKHVIDLAVYVYIGCSILHLLNDIGIIGKGLKVGCCREALKDLSGTTLVVILRLVANGAFNFLSILSCEHMTYIHATVNVDWFDA